MSSASENIRKLFSESTGLNGSSLSKAGIQKMQLSSNLISEIQICLFSQDQSDISTGFLFLNSLLEINKPKDFGNDFFELLVRRVSELITHNSKFVCYQALELYVWLKDNYPNYCEVMKSFLSSNDLGFRRIALHHYETYTSEKEITPLLGFSDDRYTAERGMNSVQFFELRDVALAKISSLVGKSFCGARLSEPFDGTVVSWYDWSSFFDWWDKEKSNYL